MPTTSIDDLLMGEKTSQHPETPENQHIESQQDEQEDYLENEPEDNVIPEESTDEDDEPKKESETDEYGNSKEPENAAIRERLARQARKYESEIDVLRSQLAQQGASQQVQQAAKDFEYNPEKEGDWQQQLASFVKQTVNSMHQEEANARHQHEERQTQMEFESKFREGVTKFDDFAEVIHGLSCEITNPMTLATRSMNNPAAFLYAAAKQQPQELERISKLRDPYAQMTEIGKLEERMRRNKPTTNAPKPLGRTREDATIPYSKEKKEESIEDLIAKSDAKRISKMKT